MTIYCAVTKRVVPSPQALISVAEVTLPETEEEWLSVARRWFDGSTMFGDREVFLLTELRKALQNAPAAPTAITRKARFKSYQ